MVQSAKYVIAAFGDPCGELFLQSLAEFCY